MNDLIQEELKNDAPAVYLIQVQGNLDSEWVEDLGNMQLFVTRTADQNEVMTTLIGKLQDQAMLAGVLNLLQSLGMPLLTVSCLGRPFQRPNVSGRK